MSDDENIPDATTAQKLIKEFEGVTNTNEALAQEYLQVCDMSVSYYAMVSSKIERENYITLKKLHLCKT